MKSDMAALACGCHAVSRGGKFLSRLEQFSASGKQGIRTKIGEWRIIPGVQRKDSGYRQVTIHGKSARLSRLIANTFIANPKNYPEVRHLNGIRTDNRVENLAWGSQKHNADDRELHGHSVHGSRSPNAKLTDAAVREIRAARVCCGETFAALANRLGVSKKAVMLVAQNKTWRHIK